MPKRPRVRPGLECLEARRVLSTITELPTLPTLNSAPAGITEASDGSIWFTEQNSDKLGRISPQGTLTEYTVPTANSAPTWITASPNGDVWFTELKGGKIGEVGAGGGAIAEYALPGSSEVPTAITTRSNGTVWFASEESPGIARVGTISSTGKITEVVSILQSSTITGLVGGPDGNLWLTVTSTTYGDSVDKLSTVGRGTFTRFALPSSSASPQGITVGPDNNLWFTEAGANQIGRISTTGLQFPAIALPAGSDPEQIVTGPDGAVWFTQPGTDQIGRLTTSGTLSELAVPTVGAQPFGIAAGPNSTLWFTEQSGNRIGYVTVSGAAVRVNSTVRIRPGRAPGAWDRPEPIAKSRLRLVVQPRELADRIRPAGHS